MFKMTCTIRNTSNKTGIRRTCKTFEVEHDAKSLLGRIACHAEGFVRGQVVNMETGEVRLKKSVAHPEREVYIPSGK